LSRRQTFPENEKKGCHLKKKGYQLMTELKKLQEVIQGSVPTQAKKEAAAGKPIIHILNPSACWTTTVATTVPPEEQ